MNWFALRLAYFTIGIFVGILYGMRLNQMLIRKAGKFFSINVHLSAIRTLIKAYLLMTGSSKKESKKFELMMQQLREEQVNKPRMTISDFDDFLKKQSIKDRMEENNNRD